MYCRLADCVSASSFPLVATAATAVDARNSRRSMSTSFQDDHCPNARGGRSKRRAQKDRLRQQVSALFKDSHNMRKEEKAAGDTSRHDKRLHCRRRFAEIKRPTPT